MNPIARITPSLASEKDIQMRLKAFARVRELTEIHGHLTKQELDLGFEHESEIIQLHSKAGQGIWKPTQMDYLLSVKTVIPEPGGKVWYEDQLTAHQSIFGESDAIDYDFMGKNPHDARNQWLRNACELQIPIIYFLGIAPRRYQAIMPTFIQDWDQHHLKVRLVFGDLVHNQLTPPENHSERRYALRIVKQRLHQSTFREAVINAYGGRCAISRLREPRLIDAAHIVPDKDIKFGQPIVPNGLPLSKIHHAAFDANLLGVDPDYKLHLSERLLVQQDGPMLELLKEFHGKSIQLPKRPEDCPDRDRLAVRFENFKSAA